jgi:hypothetical protein
MTLRLAGPLLLLAASCMPPQPAGTMAQAPSSREDEIIMGCALLCEKALGCKGSTDGAQLEPCVIDCAQRSPEPQQLQQLAALECRELLALGGGGQAPQPGQPGAPAHAGGQAGQPAELTGVWVGEESSLDPSFYMRYTQVITLYPDGSVGWAKSEGAASRTRIDESWVRFRSWRTGQTAPDVYGSWQSDGQRISIQWRRRQNPSVGPVQGGRMRLSGMGVLSEGADVVFEKQ